MLYPHLWVRSTLGHGDSMCQRCRITNREAAVLDKLNDCPNHPDRDKPERRHKAPPGECPTCDREREKSSSFHPPHDASSRCESGKHTHCSCDTCF